MPVLRDETLALYAAAAGLVGVAPLAIVEAPRSIPYGAVLTTSTPFQPFESLFHLSSTASQRLGGKLVDASSRL